MNSTIHGNVIPKPLIQHLQDVLEGKEVKYSYQSQVQNRKQLPNSSTPKKETPNSIAVSNKLSKNWSMKESAHIYSHDLICRCNVQLYLSAQNHIRKRT